MSTENMMYNSQMDNLIISEYGRNIQNMIAEVKAIEDDAKRQEYAEAIVALMNQMNPVDRSAGAEGQLKLWRHLFKIAGYDINVTPPDGIIPTEENTRIEPLQIEYPETIRKNRHYGKNVQALIAKAMDMEDEEKKKEFVMIIAAYMKLAYRTWNREHFVSDDVIKQDLAKMSEGQIQISEDDSIIVTAPMPSRNTYRKKNHRNNGRNHRNNGRNNNRNNNRGRQKRR